MVLTYDSKQVSQFDLSTYYGRFRHFQKIISPRNFFYLQKTLMKHQKTIEHVKDNPEYLRGYSDDQIWKIRYIADANFHPQTKELISFPFRPSTFVPMNIPIVFFLSLLPPTLINQIVGQTVNQTYNFLYNYSNRNTSNPFSGGQLAFSYIGAVAFALIGSLGTTHLVQRFKAPQILMSLTPVTGVVLANAFNLYFSRSQDFTNGIEVYDAETQEKLPGKSQIAAKEAFQKTLIQRSVLPLPVFTIPQMIVWLIKRRDLYPKTQPRILVLNTVVSAVILYVGLSGAIALFPQIVNVPSDQLEPQYHNLKNSLGQPVKVIQYNKGI